ncbi:21881_t:CDS:2 [Gigaspora margarita]|uniref:21881_t:CDS:1 n=1 Tax=Gigaspora margarita TaxID=4874 RepID=A0ABM8W2A8_GIGMA|nr:21881_t:CDS:2 [Gigaspora margarita]
MFNNNIIVQVSQEKLYTSKFYYNDTSANRWCHGQATDIAIHAKEILRVRERLSKIYKKHCNKRTLEEIEIAIERDYYMTAEEALKFGLVDRVLEKREVTPSEQLK